MFNPLPLTKEDFLNMKKLPLNNKIETLLEGETKTLSIEMNKITQAIIDLVDKIDYDSVEQVAVSEEFIEYKKLPALEPVKVNGQSLQNALTVIEAHKKVIERLNLYKDAVVKMYEEQPLISEYVTLNTDLLILNHQGSVLTVQKYINGTA